MLVTFGYCTYWFSAKLFHYFMRDENLSMIKTPGEVWIPGRSIFEKISEKIPVQQGCSNLCVTSLPSGKLT